MATSILVSRAHRRPVWEAGWLATYSCGIAGRSTLVHTETCACGCTHDDAEIESATLSLRRREVNLVVPRGS